MLDFIWKYFLILLNLSIGLCLGLFNCKILSSLPFLTFSLIFLTNSMFFKNILDSGLVSFIIFNCSLLSCLITFILLFVPFLKLKERSVVLKLFFVDLLSVVSSISSFSLSFFLLLNSLGF